MSKLEKFLGVPKEIEINGETIKIYPLKVKDIALFNRDSLESGEETLKISREIIKKSLADENLTDEQIEAIDMKTFKTIMDAINEINGFAEENEKIKRIRTAQAKTISK